MANSLYDFELSMAMNYSFPLYHFKSEIKPIWILNEMAGGRSGCMMWPGSDFEYDGVSCSYNRHYNLSVNYKERVDEVFEWILNETAPANLIMFYIEEPDLHAHAFGPESSTITEFVAQLNHVTEYFHQKIQKHDLENRVNVVHLSDHGMDSLELRNVINLTSIIGDKAKFYGTTPVLQIVPNDLAETDLIYKQLFDEAAKNGNFKVYTVLTLPKRWHFNNKFRVGPITAVADLGFGFQGFNLFLIINENSYNFYSFKICTRVPPGMRNNTKFLLLQPRNMEFMATTTPTSLCMRSFSHTATR